MAQVLEGDEDLLRHKFWLGPAICLGGAVGSMPLYRAVDPGLSPSPGAKFPLKLTT